MINQDVTHVAKLTKKKILQLADKYVEETDFDGDCIMDKDEFKEFFINFQTVCLVDNEIDALFERYNRGGNGLTKETFAACL